MNGLNGKTAIVTGGSSGIGQAIAVRLAQEGVRVAINYVGPDDGARMTADAIAKEMDACLCALREAGTEPIMIDGQTVIGPIDEASVEIVRRNLDTLGGLERNDSLHIDFGDRQRQMALANQSSGEQP